MKTLLALGLGATAALGSGDAPPEFGTIQWGRKLEPGLEKAARSDRPVLLLFQEVPG